MKKYLQECIDKTGIVSKALLSSDWHHEWDSVQATLQSVSAVFFVLGVKTVLFFLCAIEHYSIIKLVFLHKIKRLNRMIGKPDESLGRKATGPVKWQPVV